FPARYHCLYKHRPPADSHRSHAGFAKIMLAAGGRLRGGRPISIRQAQVGQLRRVQRRKSWMYNSFWLATLLAKDAEDLATCPKAEFRSFAGTPERFIQVVYQTSILDIKHEILIKQPRPPPN